MLAVWQATAAQTMGGKFIACLSGISAFVAIGLVFAGSWPVSIGRRSNDSSPPPPERLCLAAARGNPLGSLDVSQAGLWRG